MDSAVLGQIIGAAPCAMVLVEHSSRRIVDVNSAFTSLFEFSREDLIDANACDLTIWPSDKAFTIDHLLLSERAPRNLEVRLSSKTGLQKSVLLSVAPLRLDSVDVDLLMLVDKTDNLRLASQSRTLQDELAHVLRLGTLGEMASTLAHELNQPLTSICLYASSALDLIQHSENDEMIECLTRVNALGRHAGAIVERIRTFAGSRRSHRARHSINDLVEQSLRMLHPEITATGISLAVEFSEQLPEVKVDGVQIQQVLINLIRNAIEAMSEVKQSRRILRLKTEPLDNKVCVRVSDTGRGIDPTIAEHLFEPFRTTKEEGLGLGLRICHTLIASHGGTLDVRANAARGATFSFVLPIADFA